MPASLDPAGLDEYFSDIPVDCPYGLNRLAVYHQAVFAFLPPALLDRFLAAGFRRNGDSLYSMHCQGCDSCIPIRLATCDFASDQRAYRKAGWRRVLAKNSDLEVEMGVPEVSREKLNLLDRFLQSRYPGKENGAVDYYGGFFLSSLQLGLEISFRLAGKLIGVSVVDLGEKSISAVYFYFDPDYAKRSLGSFNILFLADLTRQKNLRYLYLGYWIREVAAMEYKARFRPHELLRNGLWQRVK